MLVAGLYDGTVAVYNLLSSLIRPLNIALIGRCLGAPYSGCKHNTNLQTSGAPQPRQLQPQPPDLDRGGQPGRDRVPQTVPQPQAPEQGGQDGRSVQGSEEGGHYGGQEA